MFAVYKGLCLAGRMGLSNVIVLSYYLDFIQMFRGVLPH